MAVTPARTLEELLLDESDRGFGSAAAGLPKTRRVHYRV
jgi:hypothetical protein